MTAETAASGMTRELPHAGAAGRNRFACLRTVAIAAGIAWSLLFLAVGPAAELQMYGDGSVFSYAIAVQDAWTIHWHNIPGRLFVYLYCVVPAEAFVAWSGNAHGGIVIYGLLRDSAPLLGVAATFLADRSRGRILLTCACLSTACAGPLVFGFPTEMWIAHALFWPALAACHYARGLTGGILVFVLLLALALTHEGALVLVGVILIGLALRGIRDAAFLRTAATFASVLAIWLAIKAEFSPDAYIVGVMADAGWNFFNPRILAGDLMLLLIGTLVAYGLLVLILRRIFPDKAEVGAALLTVILLGVYWLWFDQSLHAQDRYFLRTVLLLATASLGLTAAAYALASDGALNVPVANFPRVLAVIAARAPARPILFAVLLVMTVHAVETAKFVAAWAEYKGALGALAMGQASDPALGDRGFVSSARLGDRTNRMSWSSTTPYLSILLAPKLAPARLVVDPDAGYFWLSCRAAIANEQAPRAVPAESRRLVRILECLHRR